MRMKKILSAMVMAIAVLIGSPVLDLPPSAVSVAHAQDVWAYGSSNGDQFFVMSETIQKYSDGGINCRVKTVVNGKEWDVKTYNFMPRYSNGVIVDWNYARAVGSGWEDLGLASKNPFAWNVINVCLRYA
ncbi:hypothetical protein [Anaerovibrio lipolyticus]|uniref:hypothetical protein n=1 Tax=Anaerovibrio lipolyticus TaxID=82374 RepID=UPI0023EF56C0|nr:hypothetical protein [Anaerovibrio lipolyticus]